MSEMSELGRQRLARVAKIKATCECDPTWRRLNARRLELEKPLHAPQIGWDTFFQKGKETLLKHVRRRVDQVHDMLLKEFAHKVRKLTDRVYSNIEHNLQMEERSNRKHYELSRIRIRLWARRQIIAALMLARDTDRAIATGNLSEAKRRLQSLRQGEILAAKLERRQRPLTATTKSKPPRPGRRCLGRPRKPRPTPPVAPADLEL